MQIRMALRQRRWYQRTRDLSHASVSYYTIFPFATFRAIRTTRTYGPYVRVHFWHPYIRPVFTARIYGCNFVTRIYGPYVRVSKMHPYTRAINTARIYGCSVHTTRIEVLFCTGRIYGPYLRVVRIGLYSSAREQPASVDRFALSIRHVTCFRARGSQWDWLCVYKRKWQTIKTCILSKLLYQFQPNFAQW